MKGYFRKRGCKCLDKKKCSCGATWSFTIDVGRDPGTGKRKQEVRSGFKKKGDAEKACAELITEYERGNLAASASSKDTLGGFMKKFLETILINDVERNTYEGKVGIMNNHITPKIGSLKLQKISPFDLQVFYNGLQEDGLSAGTIQNISRLINQTLNTAVEWGYISKNVNKLARKPSYKKQKMAVWTKDEYEQFLADTVGCRFHPYYLIALNTGMRPGEIFALSWDNVNFKQKYIRVDGTVVYTKENGIEIKPSPKNDSSVRNITIPDHVVNYLKRLKLEQEPNPLNLVIPGIKSDIVYNSAINKAFTGDLKKSNVPRIGLHDMRHTHATYLLSPPPFGLGIGIKAVMERLGHAKATTTLNTYAHVLPNMQEAIADNLEKQHVLKSVDK